MAGDWIKMRVNLPSDPQVIKVARLLGCSEFKVVGLLHWLWGWADSHTEDGRAVGIDCAWINRQTQTEGFCEALVDVGWLVMLEDGVEIPNFNHHNGTSAKTRANSARRAASYKTRQKVKPKEQPKEQPKPKPKAKFPKIEPLMVLLRAEGEFACLLQDNKGPAVMQWVNHLNERLPKAYSAPGAKALLTRIDEMSLEELERAVEYSLEGNYQKLILPKENYGRRTSREGTGKEQTRFSEYDE